jgi:Core-2/I-Branching enzyme
MVEGGPVAAVLLAYQDPAMVARTIVKLGRTPVFMHCDQRTDAATMAAMVPPHGADVHLLPRLRTKRYGWTLVQAELSGLAAAVARTRAEHIVVMSGNCYPLLACDQLEAQLAQWHGESHIIADPMPHAPWDAWWARDGGLWRLRTRFLMHRDNVVTVFGQPIPTWRRRIPATIVPHASSQWKVYARSHAEALLRHFDDGASDLDFWRHTFCPEEICLASLLAGQAAAGSLEGSLVNHLPWYVNFDERLRNGHPSWLTADDFDAIRQARADRAVLFARKIRSTETQLLDRIDVELSA